MPLPAPVPAAKPTPTRKAVTLMVAITVDVTGNPGRSVEADLLHGVDYLRFGLLKGLPRDGTTTEVPFSLRDNGTTGPVFITINQTHEEVPDV